MKLAPVSNIQAFLQGFARPNKIVPKSFCCKICEVSVADLRVHLAQVHDMSLSRYRSLGQDYSLLPASYAARRAAYLNRSSAR